MLFPDKKDKSREDFQRQGDIMGLDIDNHPGVQYNHTPNVP